jgi:beta-RFAP synthase
VSTPARLHLGFLDLNGSSGRKFGSIGLAINSHFTTINIKKNSQTQITTPQSHPDLNFKIEALLKTFYQNLGASINKKDRHVDIKIEQLIPEHAGFGSGTQLTLAIGMALCRLHDISISTPELARYLGRGARSGIGIATFDQGGFIIDAGLSPHSSAPPVIAQYSFPEEWRIVLIMNEQQQGVHGQQEKQAFSELSPFPLANSHAICHLSLMQLLPALIEKNIDQFGDAVTKIQALIGDHFAPVQGGRYTSRLVADLLFHAEKLGHRGIAQSSWGPTGCVFIESQSQAEALVAKLKQHTKLELKPNQPPSFIITQANEIGAKIEICPV